MTSSDQDAGSHPSEPVRTPENPLEYRWLTVDDAVSFCVERGLSRTPKTLRKWAERSYNKPDADIIVRRADTLWGYRWKIEKTSLARKVDQELSVAAPHPSEPVRTRVDGQQQPDHEISSAPETNQQEPVRTSSGQFAQNELSEKDEHRADASEQVRTRLTVQSGTQVEQELRDRLKDKNAEIAFLREQLGLSQSEVGQRAKSTDEALKTIDRVVRSFEMQAEANKALALGAAHVGEEHQVRRTAFTPRSVDDAEAAPIETQRVYQQPDLARDDV